MTTAPKRRWFRFAFSLRTLFLLVTVAACWLGYELNWIRQRQSVLDKYPLLADLFNPPQEITAPGLLWIFGDRGWSKLQIGFSAEEDRELNSEESREVERIQKLFPEARVYGFAVSGISD